MRLVPSCSANPSTHWALFLIKRSSSKQIHSTDLCKNTKVFHPPYLLYPPPSLFLQVSEEISWPVSMCEFATPLWVLIYSFRLNLHLSGCPRPLIRLWGVDTTLNTHTDLEKCTQASFFSPTHTHNAAEATVPALRHALWRQSSSALCGPLSHSGSPQLHQSPRQDREKEGGRVRKVEKKGDILYLLKDRKRCRWWKRSSLNFFHFKPICQVKVTLSHIGFWQTQVAAGDRCWNFLKFKDFTAHESSNMILVTCAKNPNSLVKKTD